MSDKKEEKIVMNPLDFGSNSKSNNKKEEEILQPKPKAITSDVKIGTPSVRKIFKDVFIAEDIKEVKTYFIFDVLIPGIKHTILNILEMMLLGESARANSRSSGHTDYTSYSRDDRKSRSRKSSRDDFRFSEVAFNSRASAQEVLENLIDDARRYGKVSVATFKQYINKTEDYTDHDWGWEYQEIKKADVSRYRDKYIINFPRIIQFDD